MEFGPPHPDRLAQVRGPTGRRGSAPGPANGVSRRAGAEKRAGADGRISPEGDHREARTRPRVTNVSGAERSPKGDSTSTREYAGAGAPSPQRRIDLPARPGRRRGAAPRHRTPLPRAGAGHLRRARRSRRPDDPAHRLREVGLLPDPVHGAGQAGGDDLAAAGPAARPAPHPPRARDRLRAARRLRARPRAPRGARAHRRRRAACW